MKRLAEYLSGVVRFEIMGGRGEAFFNECAARGIAVQEIRATPTGYTARVPLRNYCKLHRSARHFRCKLRVQEKFGLYFALRIYQSRKGIAVGAAAFLTLFLLFQNLVWNIYFYNFTPIQQQMLRTQLYEKGVYEGCFYNKNRFAKVQSELFIENGVYGWVKMNYNDGKLVVEKTDLTSHEPLSDKTATDVVASSDGIVQQLDVKGGFVRVQPGQAVAEGELLVSGVKVGNTGVPFYTHADARVYASVEKVCEVFQPYEVTVRQASGNSKSLYAISALGARLALYRQDDANIPETQTQVLRYPLTVAGISLPVTVEETQMRAVSTQTVQYTKRQAQELAKLQAYDSIANELPQCAYLTQQETFTEEADGVRLKLKVSLLADIGRVVPLTGQALAQEPGEKSAE